MAGMCWWIYTFSWTSLKLSGTNCRIQWFEKPLKVDQEKLVSNIFLRGSMPSCRLPLSGTTSSLIVSLCVQTSQCIQACMHEADTENKSCQPFTPWIFVWVNVLRDNKLWYRLKCKLHSGWLYRISGLIFCKGDVIIDNCACVDSNYVNRI